jgi:hypothetical protein
MTKLEAGQIWRKPNGEEIEILEVFLGGSVEAQFSGDDRPCWVLKTRFIGPSASCAFVRRKEVLPLSAA